MYVLTRVFNLEDSLLLCPIDNEEGAFLLAEIMKGGNFGQYDARFKRVPIEKRWLRGVETLKRDLRFLCHYPGEVLWMPAWKLWHWTWRKTKGYLRNLRTIIYNA